MQIKAMKMEEVYLIESNKTVLRLEHPLKFWEPYREEAKRPARDNAHPQ